ncbi:MAG: hypothetical protein JO180_01275, partial [Gemmatirosa sp.]|nr:hypothetical protein [Gemmatirosa sp.]
MPRSSSTRWYAALAVLVVFVLLAWLLGAVLTLTDGERVVLRVALIALGLVAAGALLWFLRPRGEPIAVATGPDRDDALVAVATARARMPRGAFDARPVVLVAGSRGSCKTTVVTRAGLDAELLAGDAGEAPTDAANVWLAGNAVLAEPGGPVFADPGRWAAFVRSLRAPRLGAALGRAAPAPRAAVLCVSCDLFYTGGAGEQLDALAQTARQRLTEAARELGVALPVYVLFTKADRIPHFEAWAAPLDREEIRQPLGTAVPLEPAALAGGRTQAQAAGSHAERLVPWIEGAFARLAGSLAARRLDWLPRETTPERRLAAYELPRELAKLTPAATRFLVELTRPTQLGASPQLRGFYFVGARPVVVTDVGDAAAAPAAASAPRPAAGATSAFIRPNAGVAAPASPVAYGPPTSRRVPQWSFLERLFPDVVLADPAAAALAGGGTRVAGLRRGLLGAGIAAALLLSVGVVVSWLGNRSLADRTAVAARGVAALPIVAAAPGTIAFPSPDALRRLDALRGVLDTLNGYETAGVPLHLRWGLWRGGALLADGRRVWFDGYRRQLHDAAWTALVDSLKALPDAPRPTDDYGHDYAALKAYLVMTAAPDSSKAAFLAPTLLDAWQRGQPTDADVTALARRQFEFYATELPRDNPWPRTADAALVTRTRDFLGRFAGAERIYQYMLAEADKTAKPARLAEVAPQAAGIVSAQPEVPGAFTAAGWKFMQDAFGHADRFFQGERWVVGDAGAAQSQDRDRVLAELRTRYRTEYVARWRTFVRSITTTRPANARDAAQKLGVLGGPQSPLLAALALASRNTNVDSAMAAGFQPVHAVTPPAVVDKLTGESNQGYVDGLVALQGDLEQLANQPPVTDTASAQAFTQFAQQAMSKATQAKTAARQLAGKFNADTAATQVGPVVASLLLAPIEGADGVLRGAAAVRPPTVRKPAAGGGGAPAAPVGGGAKNTAELIRILNERGAALCAQLTPMLAKFPFSPDAPTDATLKEVSGVLAPDGGALWSFQRERLGG